MEELILNLAKYSSNPNVIIVILIGVIVWVLKDYHKITSNHLSHLTKAYERNTDVIERVVGENTKATRELRDVVLGCKYNKPQ